MTTQNNPLLQEFDHAPFSKIKNEHFKPAIIKAIEMAREEINAIASNADEATFPNTIETLEFSGEKLDRVTSIFFNLNSAETNEEIQQIAQEVSPLLSEFRNDIILNKALFEKVKSVYNKKDQLDLNTEQKTLLDRKYKAFSRNGANLPVEKQNELFTRMNEISVEEAQELASNIRTMAKRESEAEASSIIADAQSRAREILEKLKLTEIAHRSPTDVSNGQQKRVSLARALITHPTMMIYDEPTTGQDPIMCDYVEQMILEAHHSFDLTSVIISHDMASTFRIGDHVAMLYQGQIIAEGPSVRDIVFPLMFSV